MKEIEQLKKRERIETVEPLGRFLLVRKDPDKNVTAGGIILPDDHKIPVLTGRVLEVSSELKGDTAVRKYDRVIVNPERAIRIDLEDENLYLVPISAIIGRISTKRV